MLSHVFFPAEQHLYEAVRLAFLSDCDAKMEHHVDGRSFSCRFRHGTRILRA